MNVSEAVFVLSNTIFRPGWTISATANDYRPGIVELHLVLDTVDTSEVTSEGTYTTPHVMDDMYFDLRASEFSTVQELLYHVLQLINGYQEHEDREFLRVRVGDQWVAPFHPHTFSGDLAWSLTGEPGTSEKLRALMSQHGAP